MPISFQGAPYPSKKEAITYYGGDLVNYSVFNGGLYTSQTPANYWQRGVLLRDAQTDSIQIPIPKNWESNSVKIKIYAGRSGGTAALSSFVLYQRSRYIVTPNGIQAQQAADLNTSTVTYSFVGDNNTICYNFEIDILIRPFSINETRFIALARQGNDAADTMNTSLIVYQIDITQN
jgi:hypothetical protein